MDIPKDIERLVAQVNQSNISSISGMVVRIVAIANDPEASAKDLVDIIHTDPPLAANVLRLVNSAYYAPRRKIADIHQAVIFIGFNALKELALNQKVCEIFQSAINIEGYSRQALWRHSVAVGQFAKMVYRREFAEQGGSPYAVGLLHDLGIIIEDQFRNPALVDALQLMNDEKLVLCQAEQRILGYDHCQIGAAVSQAWHFPDEIIYGIEYHHTPDRAPDEFSRIAATLFVADQCCQQAEIGFCDTPAEDAAIFNACIDTLGIERHAIDLIAGEVNALMAKMIERGLV
jgi:HD-like signal output (HDOD) protein